MKSSGLWPSGSQGASAPIPSVLLPRLWFLLFVLPRHVSSSLHVHIKVQHQQLGLLCAVAAAHRAYQLGVGGPDAPHHAAAAAALQGHQVSDELARFQVPQFDRAVVRAGDDKVLVELEARHSALVLVGTWETQKGLVNMAECEVNSGKQQVFGQTARVNSSDDRSSRPALYTYRDTRGQTLPLIASGKNTPPH